MKSNKRIDLLNDRRSIIGGLFGLANPTGNASSGLEAVLDRALLLANARSGIRYLVKLLRPGKIWMPSYLCTTMVSCIAEHYNDVAFYPVDGKLRVSNFNWAKRVKKGHLVCIIDYFGLRGSEIIKEMARASEAWVLEDACQALLTKDTGQNADFLLFSPRKFLGVPDGGILLSSSEELIGPQYLDDAPAEWWLCQFSACLERRDFDRRGAITGSRAWFTLFRHAETIAPIEPYAMSSLSKGLLRTSFDLSEVRARRRENYEHLIKCLGSLSLMRALDTGEVPLGFPVQLPSSTKRDELRYLLVENGIYPPVHWDISGVVPGEFKQSHGLSATCMTIPCDQRYRLDDMSRIVDIVKEWKLTANVSSSGIIK